MELQLLHFVDVFVCHGRLRIVSSGFVKEENYKRTQNLRTVVILMAFNIYLILMHFFSQHVL